MITKIKIWPFISAAFGIFIIAMSFYISHFNHISDDPQKWSYFGDYIGGIMGPSLSFISLIGVIYSLRQQQDQLEMQKNELELQRTELQLQREEMELQRREQERQTEESSRRNFNLELQQFDSTFFRMLEQQTEIRQNLTFNSMAGRNAVKEIISTINTIFSSSRNYNGGRLYFENPIEKIPELKPYLSDPEQRKSLYKNRSDRSQYVQIFEIIYPSIHNCIGHYLRHLYQILKFVDTRYPGDSDNNKTYIDIIQSELSENEFMLLFYNGLLFPKAFEYYTKFKLIENLPVSSLPFITMQHFYPGISFREQSGS